MKNRCYFIIFFKKILKAVTKRDIMKQTMDEKNGQNASMKSFVACKNRMGKIMCRASEIGKIVVNKCLDNEIQINTQKLQKLLVLMQVESCLKNGQALFKEDVLIWDCGVAIKEVDVAFKQYAVRFTKEDRQLEYITLLDSENCVIDSVLEKYGKSNIPELNRNPFLTQLVEKYRNLGRTHIPSTEMVMIFKQYDIY